MKNIIIVFFSFALYSCQKEQISTQGIISEQFYVENNGAKMPVLIEGNINSNAIVLWVHGGPGGTAIGFENDAEISSMLEPHHAVAYWDQRVAGNSQGGFTPKLELSQYVDDLKKVVAVIKKRYGSKKNIYMLSHSWGGMVAPAFLCEDNNQDLIKGWINVAGEHSYQKNDSLTREYLMRFGTEQIKAGRFVKEWTSVIDIAKTNVPNYTFQVSKTLNACASKVEQYIPEIKTAESDGASFFFGLKNLFWLASNGGNTYISGIRQDILKVDYSEKLKNIKIPMLSITGKYDFIVPSGMADEAMKKVSSNYKKQVILQESGHICMKSEPDLFYKLVKDFVDGIEGGEIK
jgi:pimeloyl-ACP methyl ester carboxylesterase